MYHSVYFQLKGKVMNVLLANANMMVSIRQINGPHPVVLRRISPHGGQRFIPNRILNAVLVDVFEIKDQSEFVVVLNYKCPGNVTRLSRATPGTGAQAPW